MMWEANFATIDDFKNCMSTGNPFNPRSLVNYLKVEPITDHGLLLRGKFYFRHTSPYSLEMGHWDYVKDSDLSRIVPIAEFREKKKPFYVTFGLKFYKVVDVRINDEKVLEFSLENTEWFWQN